jgi:GDPmannose 4,6-dehydratase
MPIVWRGEGIEEKGYDQRTGRVLVEIDPRYFRPTEVEQLLGDARKAHEALGWSHQTPVRELVSEMVRADIEALGNESLPLMLSA